MSVEPEKREDGLDKDGGETGEVSSMMSVDVQSFNFIVWPRPFWNDPLKCDVGHTFII